MIRKKKNLTFIIVLVLLCLGIGYAYLTTTLSINGVTDVDRNVWDVYFDNINVTTGSVTGTQVIDAPEIGNDDVSVSYHVNLKEPGDFYEFTIDAKNDGTIDAMIETISKKVNGSTTIPAYLNFSVKYADGMEIINKHMLAHEDLETYRVRVEYRTDIDPSDLPSTAQSLTLSFAVEYVQADSSVIYKPDNIIYSSFNHYGPEVEIGSPIPNGLNTYTTPEDAMAGFFNAPYFLKHEMFNNNIIGSYIGFVFNDNIYYMRGGGATYNSSTHQYNDDSIYFDANKGVLNSVFGSSNCHIEEEYDIGCYTCQLSASSYFTKVCPNGSTYIADQNYGCTISDNVSVCGYID